MLRVFIVDFKSVEARFFKTSRHYGRFYSILEINQNTVVFKFKWNIPLYLFHHENMKRHRHKIFVILSAAAESCMKGDLIIACFHSPGYIEHET